MKKPFYVTIFLALALIAAGTYALFHSGSHISLFFSVFFAALLGGCSYLLYRKKPKAEAITVGFLAVLLGVFLYRWSLTHEFFPFGILLLLLTLGLLMLIFQPSSE